MSISKKVSPRIAFYLFAVLVIIVSVVVSIVALAKVSALNQDQQIQIFEDDYNVLCLVSQMVGENITTNVLNVVSNTGKEVQDVVFELYPNEYATACDLMRITDEALRLG